MRRRVTVSPFNAVLLAFLAAALLVLFLASSRGLQVAGLVVAVVIGFVLLAGGLSDALRGGYLRFISLGRLPGGRVAGYEDSSDPDPEYIPEAAPAPDAAWERERAHYREKQQQERP